MPPLVQRLFEMSRNSTSLILEQCLTIVHSSVGGGGGGGGISVPNCFASMESGETDPQSKWKWIRSNADRHDSVGDVQWHVSLSLS